jgi:hypothetical protein
MSNKQYDVDNHTGCWVWNGEFDPSGEPVKDGTGAFAGKKVRARTSVYREKKEIIPGFWIFSSCGDLKCVNPEHQEARVPNPEEQAQFDERKKILLKEKVERQREELLKALPDTVEGLKKYSKPGTTKINGEPCWLWFWMKNQFGYPVLPWIGDDGKATEMQVVHQILEMSGVVRPRLKEEMVVRRICKDKGCINPAHLEWVSKASMYQPQRKQFWRR